MNKKLNLYILPLIAAGLLVTFASVAPAVNELYINEIFFNPPNQPLGEDTNREFVELRGTPSMPLTNYFLIFLDTPIYNGSQFPTGSAGVIEQIFDLGHNLACTSPTCTVNMGTNGFLTLRQKGNTYANPPAGTTDLVNGLPTTTCTTISPCGPGFGSDTTNPGGTPTKSSIGASDRNVADGVSNGEIESGFTALLIHTDGVAANAPSLGQDMDQLNDGLDPASGDINNWRDHWTIIDGIGISEPAINGTGGAYDARFYAKVNYGTEVDDEFNFVKSEHVEPGCTTCEYISLGPGSEAEYAARWGNSTGQTSADWNVSDVTNNVNSGYQANSMNFRQSGNPHPTSHTTNVAPPQPASIYSSQGVPYGTILTDTLGKPNFLSGDYNKDGVVSTADYVIWRKKVGSTGNDSADNPADGNHDYNVNASDYTVFRAHFGQPFNNGSPGAGSSYGLSSSTIPEPTGWSLAALALLGGTKFRKRSAS